MKKTTKNKARSRKDQVNKDRIIKKKEFGQTETEVKPKTEPEAVKEQP